jgi:hypothetical protein
MALKPSWAARGQNGVGGRYFLTIFLLQSEPRNSILLCSHKLEFFTSEVFGNLERGMSGELQLHRHSL